MKNVITSFLKSGTGVVLSALFGIILLRNVSFKLGVEGIARFGIYRQFIQFSAVFLSWGNGFSVIENYSKAPDAGIFVRTAFKYFFLIVIFFSLLVAPFSEQISEGLFNDHISKSLILYSPAVFLGLAFFNFYRSILIARKYLLISGLLQALPFLLMLIYINFSAEILHLFIFSYLLAAGMAYVLWKWLTRETIHLDTKFVRLPEFEKTSLTLITTGAVGFFCPLIVKAISAHYIGMQLTGVLEVELGLVSYFTLAIIAGLGTFYLGTVSTTPDDIQFREKVFKLLVPLTGIGLLAFVMIQNPVIKILFGDGMLKHSPELSFFALAELFRCANWFFIFTLIALNERRTYILIDCLGNGFYILITYLLVNVIPQKFSFHVSYLAFQLLCLIMNLAFCYRRKFINPRMALLVISCSSIPLAMLVIWRLL